MMHKRLLFDFALQGAAVSFQTKNKRRKARWKEAIRKAALEEWRSRKMHQLQGPLRIVVSFFTDGDPLDPRSGLPDSDNIGWTFAEMIRKPDAVKPLKDCLEGIVYQNDRQVIETTARIKNLRGNFVLHRLSPVLADKLFDNKAFTYIKITTPSDPNLADTINFES